MNLNLEFHIVTLIFYILSIVVIVLSTNNVFILTIIFFGLLYIFVLSKNMEQFKNSIRLFIPLAVLTSFINMIFVQEGNVVLLKIFSRNITLESLIYALIMSVKILIVILTFYQFNILIDSDEAVSFFLRLLPKGTFTLLIALKLFPNMRRRVKDLKETYEVRGLNYNNKKFKDEIKNNIPILSIILEDSLESSFDIAEAAYVRGFLSGKRTLYASKALKLLDYLFLVFMAVCLIYFFNNSVEINLFNIYRDTKIAFLTSESLIFQGAIIVQIVFIAIYSFNKFRKDK